jgi:predicted nucleic acid-binding protein
MSRIIVLDTGVVGLLTHPEAAPEPERCRQWLAELVASPDSVILPEVVDYEMRRELVRRRATAAIRRLDNLPQLATYLPINTAAMRLAAELWARVRQKGRPTAADTSLDADAILAAQALLLKGAAEEVIFATTNIKHLILFAPAQLWHEITPSGPSKGVARGAE